MITWGDRIRQRRHDLGISQVSMAQDVGVKPPSVSDWESGKTKTIDGPNLIAVARLLKCDPSWILYGSPSLDPGLPEGYLTEGQLKIERARAAADRAGVEGERPAAHLRRGSSEIAIPLLEVRGSMGDGGGIITEHPNVLEMVSANIQELRRRVAFSAPQNLRLLAGYGDSMTPTYNDGDVLLIDTGVTEIKLDAVYTLERGEELFIKRIQRLGDVRFLMISDNPLYRPVEIRPLQERIRVLARVLCVWNMRKL